MTSKLIIFSEKTFLKLLGNTINEYELTLPSETSWINNKSWSHVIWDARECEICDDIKDVLESFCLLKQIDVIDTTHNLREWVQSIGGTLHMVSAISQSICIPGFVESNTEYFPSKVVVSNVCWPSDDDVIMWEFLKVLDSEIKLNIALSMYKCNIDVHFVNDLKRQMDINGVSVYSTNAVFYKQPFISIFNQFEEYVLHFQKYIEFSNIIGAKCMIYGSSSSKLVHVSIKSEYEFYKNAYITFSETMLRIAETKAAQLGITIYLKPNKKEKNCNFIFEDQHANDVVTMINHPNVVVGPIRPDGPMINYGNDFTLVEFPSTTTQKAKFYISHCYFFGLKK